MAGSLVSHETEEAKPVIAPARETYGEEWPVTDTVTPMFGPSYTYQCANVSNSYRQGDIES